jgi:enediyne biosynthesis protein E4
MNHPHSVRYLVFVLLFFACNSTPDRDTTPENIAATPTVKKLALLSESKSGIDFKNMLPEPNVEWNCFIFFNIYNGGGVSVGDINNDGLPDLYFTGNAVPNKLYLNKGDLLFEDITEKAGVTGSDGWTTGTVMADVNGDGFLDIYVCQTGSRFYTPDKRKNLLYINNGDNTFTESAGSYGIDDDAFSNHASFFDYDNDGDLDLYVMNHPIIFGTLIDERLEYEKNPKNEETDKLFRNNGNNTFTEVTDQAGIREYSFGLSVNTSDINNDGWIDIYVANDYSEVDRYYMNNGDGTFTDVIKTAMPHISQFAMGSDVADFNNDGLMDVLVVDMMGESNRRKKINMSAMNPKAFEMNVRVGRHYQYMQNTLQLNNGNNTFSDVAELGGLAYTDWSWAALFGDVDNDGNKDIFIANGERRDVRNNDFSKKIMVNNSLESLINNASQFVAMIPEEPLNNYLFKNTGDLGFDKISDEWMTGYKGYTNGAALADLDNDGDLDMVINNLDDVSMIFENTTTDANFLKVKLNGSGANTLSIGARVEIETEGNKQLVEITSTRGFLSSPDPVAHFGLGNTKKIDKLTVTWPGGKTLELADINANQLLVLNESDAKGNRNYDLQTNHWMTDVTKKTGIRYTHQEKIYDDYEKEVLLPHKYSQLGPFIATGDVNNDGYDDFYIGGAHNRPGKLFVQTGSGSFRPMSNNTWEQDNKYEDTGCLFVDVDGDNDLDLYVVSGSNEWEAGSKMYSDRLYMNDGKGNFKRDEQAIPSITTSGSCVRAGDIDGDGDMDLFVGGRVIPGKYPYPPTSYILINDNGLFTSSPESLPDKGIIGLVTDATWQDYDNDGDSDLIVVGEWMTPTILSNDNGVLTNVTEKTQLANYSGWWYSIAAADFDNDGDIDFVAGNLGNNSKYSTKEGPVEVYSKDFDDNGNNDIVLTYYNQGQCYPLRGRQCSSQQIPKIKKRFKSYEAFGSADAISVYGKKELDKSLHYKASWMKTSYIENKGNGKFEVKSLPAHVQISTVNSMVIDDVNNDGNLDIITAGNMFHAEIETCRHDASIGMVLTGDGKGNFTPHTYTETGFNAAGDVKDIKSVQQPDGSMLLLIARNNDKITTLKYHSKNIQ